MISLEYNRKLNAEYISAGKVFSRYPKVSQQAESLPLETAKLPAYSYNPSLYRANEKVLLTYRYHPKPGDFTTRLGIAELGANGVVEKSSTLPIDGFSIEDGRLFSLHGEPWLSWVESKWEGKFENAKSIVKYSRLEQVVNALPGEPRWKVSRIYQVEGGGNDGASTQKNWCLFESNENLFCVFETVPEQIVFQIQGHKIVNEYRTPASRWPYGTIRGGNIVPWKDKLLRVFHSSIDYVWAGGRIEKRYFIGCLLMNPTTPFAVVAVASKPMIFGSEIDGLNSAQRKVCHHWKANVAFPCGAVADGENLVIAVGINDAACAVVRVKDSQLHL